MYIFSIIDTAYTCKDKTVALKPVYILKVKHITHTYCCVPLELPKIPDKEQKLKYKHRIFVLLAVSSLVMAHLVNSKSMQTANNGTAGRSHRLLLFGVLS